MRFAFAAAAVAVVLAKEEEKKDDKKDTCLKGIKMAAFTDKECKEPLKDGDKEKVVTVDTDQLTALNSKCNKIEDADKEMMPPGTLTDFSSMNTVCDAKALTVKMYTDDKCEEGKKETTLEWGDCKKVKKGDKETYYMLTGATALQATAAVALAYVGSQF